MCRTLTLTICADTVINGSPSGKNTLTRPDIRGTNPFTGNQGEVSSITRLMQVQISRDIEYITLKSLQYIEKDFTIYVSEVDRRHK